ASHCATTNSPSPLTASAMVILFDAYSVMVCSSLFETQSPTASVAAAPDPRSTYSYRSKSFDSARIEVSISQQFDLQRQPERTVRAPLTDRRCDQSAAAVPALQQREACDHDASLAHLNLPTKSIACWPDTRT